jgi:energy-coupling factor transport system ATP-binding protein
MVRLRRGKRVNSIFHKSEFVLSGISVVNISESGEARHALEDIDLTLKPGEWLNLVGVNGSGKSTLARLIAGLTVEGAQGAMNRGFAGEGPSPYVMQQPDAQLFGETPREEVAFALEWRGTPTGEIRAKTERALELTGLLPYADFPWERLSGGQRQLAAAAAAAAAAGDAALIVFDEAASMLDDTSRNRLRQLAARINDRGTAVVWVTQHLDELAPDKRVTALSDGKIVFDGAGREFMYGGQGGPTSQRTPCEECGLRLPYLASFALELYRQGKIDTPLPLSADEWRKVLKFT